MGKHMRNPAGWATGGAKDCSVAELDASDNSLTDLRIQGALDRAVRHEWRVEWLGSILAMRLDQRRLLVLGAGALHGLDPDLAEELAETFLADLRAGQPIPAFDGLRAEAREWAAMASRGELRAYVGACWNRLGEADRAGFIDFISRRAA